MKQKYESKKVTNVVGFFDKDENGKDVVYVNNNAYDFEDIKMNMYGNEINLTIIEE